MRRFLLPLLLLGACPADDDGPSDCDDLDGDGSCAPDDCNDDDATIGPDAPELCNSVDDNCNGGLPEEELTDGDLDGDIVCRDCDDADATRFHGQPEGCNGIDDDCSGAPGPDEVDADGDGWPPCNECDDGRAEVHHDAEELCDGLDTNCDGVLSPVEEDIDGDGVSECHGDCDPNRNTVAPGFPEICDGVDSDCDGLIGESSEGDIDWDGVNPESEVTDQDGDGFVTCADCDDDGVTIHPGAEEVCDGVDNNCDGGLYFDEIAGNGKTTDDDQDGWSPCLGDCNDNEPLAHPEQWEILTDGVDNDCDGQGDNAPGWGPMDRPEADMLAELGALCESNGSLAATFGFDAGPNGAALGSGGPAVVTAEDANGAPVAFHFENNWDGLSPRNGSFYAVADAPVALLRFEFASPQGTVFAGFAGVEGDGSDWQASYSWNGTTLGGAAWFGTGPLVSGWNLRGSAVMGNVAWNAVEITHPGLPVTWAIDDLNYCQ